MPSLTCPIIPKHVTKSDYLSKICSHRKNTDFSFKRAFWSFPMGIQANKQMTNQSYVIIRYILSGYSLCNYDH
ncbi:hypothetical protein HanRHA438_Chr02g0048151 [Helianthus annuus]|nr:hypothetical protein HanRHA438_Chr02g0048151 [Helianthus annuus]